MPIPVELEPLVPMMEGMIWRMQMTDTCAVIWVSQDGGEETVLGTFPYDVMMPIMQELIDTHPLFRKEV